MQTIQKLTLLRAAMRKKGLAAYIIPSSDPHQSEYVADYWNARTWLSGFDGSAGTLVVTMDWAGLWTDSRYFIQAAHQLAGSGIELMEKVSGGGLEYDEYLAEQLAPESLIGLDGRLFSIFQLQFIEETFEYADLELAIDCDLVDDIWQNRPPISTQSIFSHELKYAGQSRAEKLAMVREEMEAQAADIYLVSALDEIAWLFNLRGSDTAYNPVFYAYAAITATYVYLFTDQNKIDQLLKQQLQADAVSFANYHDFATFITQIERDQVVLYDDKSLSAAHYSAMGSDYHIRLNPIKKLKAVKNEVELRHLRKTMEKDGVALLKTYRWLAAALSDGNVSEYELGKRIAQFRSEQDLYQGESFHPIVGYEAN
ncbi:MAG: aminopeptidase P family N-terminal domain-containing protein, partial [Bacteroidota bacterium]